MKNRKWLLSVALLLVVGVMLMACGADKPADDTQPSTYEETSAATTAPTDGIEDVEVQVGVGERGDYDQTEESEAATRPEEGTAAATQPEEEKPSETQPAQTQPAQVQPSETQPGETQATQPSAPAQPVEELPLTYDQYMAMTEDEQEAFVKSFATLSEFVDWWNAARAQQEKDEPTQIEGNVIDLGDLMP